MSEALIERNLQEDVLFLELARGRGNALEPEFLRAIISALRDAAAEAPRGVVLGARGKVFCAGFDLFALDELDRDGMEELLGLLYEVCRQLFAFPRPVIATLNGHAIAGGLLLALSCDARLMAQGDGRLGLSESALGLSMPPHSIELLRYSLPRRVLEKLCYGGQIYPAYKALDMQIVDELIEPERLAARAVEWVHEWTPSAGTFAANKARLKAHALAAMETARAHDGEWLDLWFSDSTQELLAGARASLRGRNT